MRALGNPQSVTILFCTNFWVNKSASSQNRERFYGYLPIITNYVSQSPVTNHFLVRRAEFGTFSHIFVCEEKSVSKFEPLKLLPYRLECPFIHHIMLIRILNNF
jgi:hypothetical protein